MMMVLPHVHMYIMHTYIQCIYFFKHDGPSCKIRWGKEPFYFDGHYRHHHHRSDFFCLCTLHIAYMHVILQCLLLVSSVTFSEEKKVREEISNFDDGGGGVANGNGKYQGIYMHTDDEDKIKCLVLQRSPPAANLPFSREMHYRFLKK